MYGLHNEETDSVHNHYEMRIMQNFSCLILHQMLNKDVWIYSTPGQMRIFDRWKCNSHDTITLILKREGFFLKLTIVIYILDILPCYHILMDKVFILFKPPISTLLGPLKTKVITNNGTKTKIQMLQY